ncbi:MAG: hypothetical protein QE263_06950 [Vampirovibrionales bacterium]|nr:hypothetical protein [Vampirovibrionales bacterium]
MTISRTPLSSQFSGIVLGQKNEQQAAFVARTKNLTEKDGWEIVADFDNLSELRIAKIRNDEDGNHLDIYNEIKEQWRAFIGNKSTLQKLNTLLGLEEYSHLDRNSHSVTNSVYEAGNFYLKSLIGAFYDSGLKKE